MHQMHSNLTCYGFTFIGPIPFINFIFFKENMTATDILATPFKTNVCPKICTYMNE